MNTHDLPLPNPPGGFIRCNENEFCHADTRPGEGRPLYQCVPNNPPGGKANSSLNAVYMECASKYGLTVLESQDGQLGFSSPFGNLLFSEVDFGSRILFESNTPFGGMDFKAALEAVVSACSDSGFNGQYLKLPKSNERSRPSPRYLEF